MAQAVVMPKAGITVESCIIGQWLKKPGDRVEIGDILFSYETDKATFECESTAAGVLLEIFFESGDEVPCLINVCAIGEEGEDVSSLRPESASSPALAAEAPAPAEKAPAAAASAEGEAVVNTSTGVSPRAKNLAGRSGTDLSGVAGTGPGGRVIERDVRRAMDERPQFTEAPAAYAAVPEAEYEDVQFSGIRRSIAKAMHQSLQSMAQLTHHHSFDATAIRDYRRALKDAGGDFAGVTLGDMVLFAVSRTLKNHPDLNANMVDDSVLRRFKHVNLGVAVDTPRGLMVPTIFNADTKSLLEISAEVKELAALCRAGNINPDLLKGGSFTVSNLGTYGVEMFTPVINPPQTGILGVCGIVERPRTGKGGGIELYPAMGISLSYDHRAVDGAPASAFAAELGKNLENFSVLLAL